MLRLVTAREQVELSAVRTAMPYYHNTDADLNVGDEIIPRSESGMGPNWGNAENDPNSVYFTKEDKDEWAEDWRGEHRYQVEPIGEVTRDPEFFDNAKDHYENIDWEDGGQYDESDVDLWNSYKAPRARVVKKLPPSPRWGG